MAQSTISQRIALEGAEDVLRQLADLGQAGEKAVQQITDATQGMGAGLGALSGFSALAQSEFGKVSAALEPVKANFLALEEAAKGVGERIVDVAKVLGVGFAAGLAGGIGGLVELIKSSEESAHQLEVQSQVLGISILDLKTFGAAAAQAGVESDRLTLGITRFQQNVGKQSEALFQDAVKFIQMLPIATSQAGVAIVQGIMPGAASIKSHIVSNIQETLPAINMLIEELMTALSLKGITLPDAVFQAIRMQLQNVAGDATKSAETIRVAATAFGVSLPAQTIFERLAVGAQKAKDPLLSLGITLGDLQKLSVTEVLLKAVDSIEKIQNPTERARLSLALFSRGWPEVLKALRDGGAGFEELKAKVEASNPDLEKNTAILSEGERAMILLGFAAKNLRDQLAAIFAPGLTAATDAFTRLIKDNLDTFKEWAKTIANEVLPGITNLIDQFTNAGNAAKGVMPGAPGAAPLPSVVTGKTGVGHVQFPQVPDIPSTPSTTAVGANEPPPGSVDPEGARKSLEALRDTAIAVGTAISNAFTTLRSVLTAVATAINAVFGTMFTASGLAAALIVGTLTGAFSLILPLIALVASAFGLLATPIGFVAAAIGLVAVAAIMSFPTLQRLGTAAAQAISSGFNNALPAISNFFGAISNGIQSVSVGLVPIVAPVFTAITAALNGAVSAVAATLSGVATMISGAFTSAIDVVEQAFNGFVNFVSGIAASIVGALQPVLDFIGKIASGLAGLVAGGGAAASAGGGGDLSGSDGKGLGLDSAATTSTFASGGRVPGGPRGTDTVPAWLTPGEFVVRMQAVRHYGADLFHSLNNMRLPFADMLQGWQGFSLGGMVGSAMDAFAPGPSPLLLAAGGVVAPSGDARSLVPVHLHMPGGESFRLDVAPGEVFDKLARHARSSAITSAGRKPSWFAS